MSKCTSCGENIGLFGSSYDCQAEDCKIAGLCKKCYAVKLNECSKCGYDFCVGHMKNHGCEEEKEESGGEDSEDENSEELSEDDVFVSKEKMFKLLTLEDYYSENVVNFLEETEKDGYVLVIADLSSCMYLFKKKIKEDGDKK